MKDPEPHSAIVFDPVYVDRVSAEIVKVIDEAQAMIAAGRAGKDLTDLAHHAQESHEVLAEHLMEAPPAIFAKLGPVCAAMGQGVALLANAADVAKGPETN